MCVLDINMYDRSLQSNALLLTAQHSTTEMHSRDATLWQVGGGPIQREAAAPGRHGNHSRSCVCSCWALITVRDSEPQRKVNMIGWLGFYVFDNNLLHFCCSVYTEELSVMKWRSLWFSVVTCAYVKNNLIRLYVLWSVCSLSLVVRLNSFSIDMNGCTSVQTELLQEQSSYV